VTKEQCDTCAKPTKHCQDPQFKHLINADCWNHTPVAPGEIPFLLARKDPEPFEQKNIENHDQDHIESLLHMEFCSCPACVRMNRRGYRKIKQKWIITHFSSD